jgi:hypothetical protein
VIVNQATIAALYEGFGSIAAGIVNDERDEVSPQLFMIKIEDVVENPETGVQKCTSVAACDASSMQALMANKDKLAALIRKVLDHDMPDKKLNCEAVVHISEAWAATATQDEVTRGYSGVAPSERPDRIDVLLVAVHTKFGSYSQTSPFVVGEDGVRRLPALIPLDFTAAITGRLAPMNDTRTGSSAH